MFNLNKGVVGWGMLAGFNGYSALENILEFTTTRAIALQRQLSTAPELTEQLYDSANEAARKVAFGDYYLGLTCAMIAGASLGMCVYRACQK